MTEGSSLPGMEGRHAEPFTVYEVVGSLKIVGRE